MAPLLRGDGGMGCKEVLKVFIDWQDGETRCICLRAKKRCRKKCAKDVVERDLYRGWAETFKQDKYGKSNMRED